MWIKIKDLAKGQRIVINNEGDTVSVGYVRVRNGKAIIFCVRWISPIMNDDDMLLAV